MRTLAALGALVCGAGLWAQSPALPQARLSYEERSTAGGRSLVLEGKTFGPYKEILAVAPSTSGTALAFAAVRKDRIYVVAQGKETGPLPAGYEVERLQIADDGRVWVLTATSSGDEGAEAAATLLLVNGRSFGPYGELTSIDYAETGGSWIAAVRTAPEEAEVLLNGKPQGPFFAVDHAWLFPDGRAWGYAVSDSEGRSTVVTNERTWTEVQNSNFNSLYPREPHWGWSLQTAEGERIVVDGQVFESYSGFRGLVLTPSGRHWGFEALKTTDGADTPVVVIDGREYSGQSLAWSRLGLQEAFTWTVQDGAKVVVTTMKLP